MNGNGTGDMLEICDMPGTDEGAGALFHIGTIIGTGLGRECG